MSIDRYTVSHTYSTKNGSMIYHRLDTLDDDESNPKS